MARLYARLNADASKHEVTRRGHRRITARLETWGGAVEVTLCANGSFTVTKGPKHNPQEVIAVGSLPLE